MSKSILEQVTAQVLEWQHSGKEPEMDAARAIVNKMRGIGSYDITVRVSLQHHTEIGGQPVKFDHTKTPSVANVQEMIRDAISRIDDISPLKIVWDEGLDVDVRRR